MRNRMKNVGILSAFCVVVLLAAVLSGCDSSTGGGGLLAAEVDLSKAGNMLATVICLQSGAPVYGATVTVNGTSIPQFIVGNFGPVTPLATPGQNVAMQFSYKDINVSSTLAMPNEPTITSPAPGTYSAGSPISLVWTLPAGTPTNIVVTVSSLYTVSSDGFSAVLPGTALGYTIPGGTLKTGQVGIPLIVEEANSTTSLGSSVSAGSVYQVANQDELDILSPA